MKSCSKGAIRGVWLAVGLATGVLGRPDLFSHSASGAAPAEVKPSAGAVPPLAHSDFEEPKIRWTKWPGESQTTMALDPTVAHSGKQSLRVTAVSSSDRFFACAPPVQFEPGKLYRISVHLRADPQVPARAVSIQINWRDAKSGVIKDRTRLAQVRETKEGDWTRRSGVIIASRTEPNAQFMLAVEHATGRVWFDNIQIENLGLPDQLPTDVWTNQTMGLETGSGPLSRFRKHQAADDRIYRMGARYNAVLLESAYIEHDLRNLQRCLGYAGRPEDKTLAGRLAAADVRLNATYLAYIKAFRSKADADAEAFTSAAGALEQEVKQLKLDIAAQLASLRPKQPVPLPANLGRQPRSVKPLEPDGRMNRLLFGCWSPTAFSDWEKPFDLEFHSSAPGAPKVHTETELDFRNVTQTCDELQKLGYCGTFAYLGFGVHEYIYAPQWFVDKHRAEPDLFKLSEDGLRGGSRGNERSLNYFHPAVREYIQDYLGKYAAFCSREPRVLFYETSQEAYPYFSTPKGQRETGYGPHAEAAFRRWLQAKYGTIAALNQAWNARYADFAAVAPPPDAYRGRKEITPLVAEFEAFRDEAYLDYLKLLYASLKAADPGKPVVARHSGLLNLINGARIFETCDILSYHRGAPQMELGSVYLNSLNRFHHRGLGYMEDFWGKQEEEDRVWDERAGRRGLEKHIARTCTWGRTLQMKWYSYTTGAYIFKYNGNWFNPQWDLTTMRYSAPGLAVAKRQMEQLDWVLTHSQIAPFQVLVLQPSATMRNQRPDKAAYATILNLHSLLFQNGVLYELVPEEYFEDGRAKFSDYRLVIVPQAKYLSAQLQQALLDFARGGGNLALIGETGTQDELARPCGLLEKALGPAAVAEKAPARGGRKIPVGRGGEAWLIPELVGLDDPLALPKLAQRQAPYPVQGTSRVERVLRVTPSGERYLFALNPDVDNPVEDVVSIEEAVRLAVDVTVPGGYPVPVSAETGRSRFTLRLGPGETAVIWLGK